ncbi:hypothetical protein D5S17_30625 [Pseudonocardiaceae bacterium YIM PH 21723]|nr:hypothetical protein D5S17_30625 [Pseudonocardiaceae bacterium YIM PH 21723]
MTDVRELVARSLRRAEEISTELDLRRDLRERETEQVERQIAENSRKLAEESGQQLAEAEANEQKLKKAGGWDTEAAQRPRDGGVLSIGGFEDEAPPAPRFFPAPVEPEPEPEPVVAQPEPPARQAWEYEDEDDDFSNRSWLV